MKTCKDCLVELPLTEYYVSHLGYYSSYCKTCTKARSKKWAAKHPQKRAADSTAWKKRPENLLRVKASQIREGMVARSRKRRFPPPEFTSREILDIIQGSCCKTGIKFTFEESRGPWTPVPDRIDSSKGYTRENVQWVCQIYNCMKWDYSEDDVATLVSALIKKRSTDEEDA